MEKPYTNNSSVNNKTIWMAAIQSGLSIDKCLGYAWEAMKFLLFRHVIGVAKGVFLFWMGVGQVKRCMYDFCCTPTNFHGRLRKRILPLQFFHWLHLSTSTALFLVPALLWWEWHYMNVTNVCKDSKWNTMIVWVKVAGKLKSVGSPM